MPNFVDIISKVPLAFIVLKETKKCKKIQDFNVLKL